MSKNGRRTYNGGNEPENIKEVEEVSPEKRSKGGKRMFPEDVKKAGKKKKTILVIAIIVAVLLVICAAGAIFIKTHVKAPEIPKPPQKTQVDIDGENEDEDGPDVSLDGEVERGEGCYTFLVAGTDKAGANTDTLMVVKYDVTNQQINVMSIPRDTCINVSWGVKKINSAYANGGIDGLKNEVKKILGFSVDYYILVDLQAFVEIVDTIGGVDFEVPVNMNYYDPTQGLSISIAAGYQHLDGENALKVARFRSGYANADIGRISTQQALLTAMAKQTLQLSNISKVDDFVKIFKEYVDTDLTLGELTWLATQMMSVDTENNIQFMTMPGNTGATIKGLSYVTIYVNKLVDMVNEYFNPYDTPITSSNLNILTLDSNGNIYSTSGFIAGDFADYTYLTGLGTSNGDTGELDDPDEPETEEPGTGEGTEPGEGDPTVSEPIVEDPPVQEPDDGGLIVIEGHSEEDAPAA